MICRGQDTSSHRHMVLPILHDDAYVPCCPLSRELHPTCVVNNHFTQPAVREGVSVHREHLRLPERDPVGRELDGETRDKLLTFDELSPCLDRHPDHLLDNPQVNLHPLATGLRPPMSRPGLRRVEHRSRVSRSDRVISPHAGVAAGCLRWIQYREVCFEIIATNATGKRASEG